LKVLAALGDEDARVADDVAAGLQQDFQTEVLQARKQFLAVAFDRKRAFFDGLVFPPVDGTGFERVLVDDADAAADGPELDAVFFLQRSDKRDDFFDRLDKWRDGRKLRADVHLQAAQLDVFQLLGSAFVEVGDGGEIDAKLVLGLAGGNVFVGVGVNVRVHADRGRGDHAELAGDLVEVAEFFLALDVERVDPLLQRIDDLVTGLANTGEGAMRRITARLDDAEEFSAGNDVEARAVGRQQAEHREVGICLHGVGDLVIHAIQRGIKAGVVVDDRARRINVERRAVLGSQGGEIDVFAEK
jgi:hypothetical protein